MTRAIIHESLFCRQPNRAMEGSQMARGCNSATLFLFPRTMPEKAPPMVSPPHGRHQELVLFWNNGAKARAYVLKSTVSQIVIFNKNKGLQKIRVNPDRHRVATMGGCRLMQVQHLCFQNFDRKRSIRDRTPTAAVCQGNRTRQP